MKSRLKCLSKLRFLLSNSPFPKCPTSPILSPFTPRTYLTLCLTQNQHQPSLQPDENPPENSLQLLKQLGCSEANITDIFTKASALKKADVIQLQSKLTLLSNLGLTPPQLVKIVSDRPRLLIPRLECFAEQLDYFNVLFGSRVLLIKAILRNPSILTYDLRKKVKPTVEMYRFLGVRNEDLIQMIIARPTLISRTSFSEEKMEFVRMTKVLRESAMYKYIVTLIGVSRLVTIRQKMANFEKFGLSEDEVLGLFGRSPLVMTLSVDKVQRNMTFILSHMKLPAKAVLAHPSLLYLNLENVLKPRVLLAGKMHEMELKVQITGPMIVTVMRMNEKRFLKVFVNRQPKEVADELMEYYKSVKGVKRLAEASKKNRVFGFPF